MDRKNWLGANNDLLDKETIVKTLSDYLTFLRETIKWQENPSWRWFIISAVNIWIVCYLGASAFACAKCSTPLASIPKYLKDLSDSSLNALFWLLSGELLKALILKNSQQSQWKNICTFGRYLPLEKVIQYR